MRKLLKPLLVALVILTLGSCKKTVYYYQEKEYFKTEKEILYYKGSPFTGTLIKKEGERIVEKSNFSEGKLNGSFESYYSNGNPKIKGSFWWGNRDGDYEEYWDNEEIQIRFKASYHHGDLNGYYSTWWANGQLQETREYREGSIDSYSYTEYDRRGGISETGNYEGGSWDGEFINYYPRSGQVKQRRYWENGEEILNNTESAIIIYQDRIDWNDGYFHVEPPNLVYFKDVLFSGITNFGETDAGTPWQTFTLKDGVLDGEYLAYFNTGNVKLKGKYVNGIREGEWQLYLDNGELYGEIAFQNDILDARGLDLTGY